MLKCVLGILMLALTPLRLKSLQYFTIFFKRKEM